VVVRPRLSQPNPAAVLVDKPPANGILDAIEDRVTPRHLSRTAVMNVADDGDAKWFRQAHGARVDSPTALKKKQTRISRILTNEYNYSRLFIGFGPDSLSNWVWQFALTSIRVNS
jgi:hypothetical protein